MTQIVTAPAPPGSVPPGPPGSLPPTPSAQGLRQRLRAGLRTGLEGTPGTLRRLTVIGVVIALLTGVVAAYALSLRASAVAQARADSAQLVRLQQVAIALVAADSRFTNGHLAYGADSPDNLNRYDEQITKASTLLVQAAEADPADAAALRDVAAALPEYTARVAAARVNNLHGYEVATGYLRQASALLRGQADSSAMLPRLDTAVAATTERVDAAFTRARWAGWLLLAVSLLGLGGLGWVSFRLARLSHRYLNGPVAAATGALALLLSASGLVMHSVQGQANAVRDGSYAAVRALAGARIAGYQAKSAESVTLIYLGTGGDYQAAEGEFGKQQKAAAERLTEAATLIGTPGSALGADRLSAWSQAHTQLYAKARNDWTGALPLATATGAGSSQALFDAFAAATATALDGQAAAVDAGLQAGALPVLEALLALAGLAAATAVTAGIAQRLEEYR